MDKFTKELLDGLTKVDPIEERPNLYHAVVTEKLEDDLDWGTLEDLGYRMLGLDEGAISDEALLTFADALDEIGVDLHVVEHWCCGPQAIKLVKREETES
jgi:hypothetical protein